nr:hypothetical protein CFP56_46633 [Quercus suber]
MSGGSPDHANLYQQEILFGYSLLCPFFPPGQCRAASPETRRNAETPHFEQDVGLENQSGDTRPTLAPSAPLRRPEQQVYADSRNCSRARSKMSLRSPSPNLKGWTLSAQARSCHTSTRELCRFGGQGPGRAGWRLIDKDRRTIASSLSAHHDIDVVP